jgi:hypothetical protein
MLSRDQNGDGQLTNEELPVAIVVAFLRGERPGEQSFYQPETMAVEKRMSEAPAWFAPADFNGDGDVSRREFLGTLEDFTRLDADGDGYIAAQEAAGTPGDEPGRP